MVYDCWWSRVFELKELYFLHLGMVDRLLHDDQQDLFAFESSAFRSPSVADVGEMSRARARTYASARPHNEISNIKCRCPTRTRRAACPESRRRRDSKRRVDEPFHSAVRILYILSPPSPAFRACRTAGRSGRRGGFKRPHG
jgi:hypothetical protein